MTDNSQKVILDLCGGTGAWSRPYSRLAKYTVIIIDPHARHREGNVYWDVQDFRNWIMSRNDNWDIYGILAAPPCTEFASSGARWWVSKPPDKLENAMEIVKACLDIIDKIKPDWWCLENPVGRLPRLFPNRLGKCVMTFQPWEYGDPYTKRTCLWGKFNRPEKNPVEPKEGGKIWRMPPSEDRAMKRSITPPSFSQAFFEANS